MRRLAIMTARESTDLFGDGVHLLPALARLGIEGVPTSWGAPVDPTHVDAVLIRATYDYIDRVDEFVTWLRDAERQVPVANPPSLIAWNTDKRYLRDLASAGVPTVPTVWVVPGDPVPDVAWGRFVVKPAVSAGARHSASYDQSGLDAAAAHIEAISRAGITAMVQPHVASVDAMGETGVYVIDGQVTHGVQKAAILHTGEGAVDDFSRAIVQPSAAAVVGGDLGGFATSVVAAIPAALGTPLYARVDVVRDDNGGPLVIEVELIEPFLFLEHSPHAAGPFAGAVDRWIRRE